MTAKYWLTMQRDKKISILYLNNDFGVGLKNTFIENYKKTGGDISNIEAFLPDDTDFRTQLTKIKASAPDGLFSHCHRHAISEYREANTGTQHKISNISPRDI